MSFSGECPLCQAEFTDWIELETHASRCEGMEMRKQPKLMNDSYTEDDELEEQKLREEETRCFQRRLRQQNKAPAASLVLGDEGDSELEDDEIETLQDNLLSCPMCNRVSFTSPSDLQLHAESCNGSSSLPPVVASPATMQSSTTANQAAKQQMLDHSLVLYTQYRRRQFKY